MGECQCLVRWVESEARDLEAGKLFATVKEQFEKDKEMLQRLSKSRLAGRG